MRKAKELIPDQQKGIVDSEYYGKVHKLLTLRIKRLALILAK